MGNKGFDLLARGIAQRLGAAEIDRVGLDQASVEAVLADQLAQAVADLWTDVIAVPVGRLRWHLSCRARFGGGPDFFDRADANPVRFAQGTIYRSGFSYAYFGSAHRRRNIC